MASDTPVFALIRALKAQGWQRGEPPATHTFDSPKKFGDSDFVSKKPYLQCLLVMQQLFDRGLSGLPSSEPMSYYKLVMHAKQPATLTCGQGSRKYESLMDSVATQILQVDPLPAHESDEDDNAGSGTLAMFAQDTDEEPASGSGSQVLPPDHGPAIQQHEQPAGMVEHGGSSGSAGQVSEPSGLDIAVVSRRGTRRYYPCSLPDVRLDVHLQPGQRGHYRRLIITCPHAHTSHDDGTYPCQKHRNLGQRQMQNLGHREPEAFLGTWAAGAHDFTSREEHVKWDPSAKQVRAWMIAEGWIV